MTDMFQYPHPDVVQIGLNNWEMDDRWEMGMMGQMQTIFRISTVCVIFDHKIVPNRLFYAVEKFLVCFVGF